jgi:hypothetical protein
MAFRIPRLSLQKLAPASATIAVISPSDGDLKVAGTEIGLGSHAEDFGRRDVII